MSAIAVTVQALLDSAEVTDLVGSRVFPVTVAQEFDLPAIAVSLIGEDQDTHLDGRRDGYMARVSIECIAETAAAADRLGEAVKCGLTGWIFKDFYTDESPAEHIGQATFWKEATDVFDFADDRSVFRRITDFRVRWTK